MSTLVVGAGPAGLAVARGLAERRLPFRLVDRRGAVGGAWRGIYAEMQLASPGRFNALPGLDFPVTGLHTAGRYLRYLERYGEGLPVERGAVEHLEPGWHAELGGARVGFDQVVVCAGIFDAPVAPFELPHARDWRGPPASGSVLVVGGGNSGVELAEECASAGLQVALSVRGARLRTLPKALLGLDLHHWGRPLEALPRWLGRRFCSKRLHVVPTDLGFGRSLRAGRIRLLHRLVAVEGDRFRFEDGVVERFDHAWLATGYRPDLGLLPRGIALRDLSPVTDAWGESLSHPGLFFLGTHCAQRFASVFLRGIALDAPRVAERIAGR